MIEDEIVGHYHQLNGHEFEQALGDGEGQGSLACCNPWSGKESDTRLTIRRVLLFISQSLLRLMSIESVMISNHLILCLPLLLLLSDSRIFSNTTVQKYQFFGAQPSLWSNSHIHI